MVLKGAKLIGANSDVSGPIENGIAPACRALVATYRNGNRHTGIFLWETESIDDANRLNMLGCHSAEAVMVGDRMDTDVISGMEVVCLLYWFSQDAQRKIHLKLMHIVQLWF